MSILLLRLGGAPDNADVPTLAVRLDDPTPSYRATYAAAVARYLDPAVTLLWAEVDVMRVSEYGPDDMAAMLVNDDEFGLMDIPQTWNVTER